MKLFRAVPKEGFDQNKVYKFQPTRRLPSNVPYLVDNIWEWLRPESAPSRRFAAYASPTKALALKNASSVGTNPELYEVCEVVLEQSMVKIAHIAVSDARYHPDIQKIVRHVAMSLGVDFSNLKLEEKKAHSALFMPGVSKEELNEYFQSSEDALRLATELKQISSFWKEASLIPQNHTGELFFEISPETSYSLKSV